MTIGRLLGDRLIERWGRGRTLGTLAAVGSLGIASGLLVAAPAAAVVGFGLLGLGLSCMVPVLFSAAGDGSSASGPSIAAVSTCGYVGFIAGPALIGGLAELSSLPAALWVLPVLTVAAGVLGRAGTQSGTGTLSGTGTVSGAGTLDVAGAVPPPRRS